MLEDEGYEGLKKAQDVLKNLNIDNLMPVEGMLIKRVNGEKFCLDKFYLDSSDRETFIDSKFVSECNRAWAAKIGEALSKLIQIKK